MDNISEHITYHEATYSLTAIKHGISNDPSPAILKNMIYVANEGYEPMRKYVNCPLHIDSFYRSLELNNVIPGSSSTSQHCRGMAIDINSHQYGGTTNKIIFNYFKDNLTVINFDQLIWEYGTDDEPDWVHISKMSDAKNRNEILKAMRKDGKVIYEVI